MIMSRNFGVQQIPTIWKLPQEIRNEIYSYILPYTTFDPSSQHFPTWHRSRPSHIALLQTNRQVYEECIYQLFTSNTFLLQVFFKRLSFVVYYWPRHPPNEQTSSEQMQQLRNGRTLSTSNTSDTSTSTPTSSTTSLPTASPLRASPSTSYLAPAPARTPILPPPKTIPLPSTSLSPRALTLLRHIVIEVDRIDEYKAALKFNVSPAGLVAGMLLQTERLVGMLLARVDDGGSRAGAGAGAAAFGGRESCKCTRENVVGRRVAEVHVRVGRVVKQRRTGCRGVGVAQEDRARSRMQEVMGALGRLRARVASVDQRDVGKEFAEELQKRMTGCFGEEAARVERFGEKFQKKEIMLEYRIRMGQMRAPLIDSLPDG